MCVDYDDEGRQLQIRLLISGLIFLGSYLPLAFILLVQDVKFDILKNGFCWNIWGKSSLCVVPLAHPKFSLLILIVCLTSFCLTLIALYMARPKLPIKIIEAKYIPAELMSYTLPYVVSFMSIGYQETGKFAGLTIFLGWMFWITHKSGQILLNPVLTVFGWRLYEIKYIFPGDSTVNIGRALAKGLVEPNRQYPHIAIQDLLLLQSNTSIEAR